jgi:hypothetical protein
VIDQEFRDAHKVSPSQIETFRLCERKWALEKLDKIPKKPNAFAQRGTDAHTVLEHWQRDGSPIDFDSDIGKIIAPGLRFLPKPGTLKVEGSFVFRTPNATYHGIKDGRYKRPLVREVWDHKTTSNMKWLKTPERLRQDPQANIYAMSEIVDAREVGEQLERVEQNWIYYLTDPDKPRARKVQLHVLLDKSVKVPSCSKEVKPEHFGIMYLDELSERFVEIEETSSKILQYHKLFLAGDIRGAADVPYDVEGCDAFGGCPYKGVQCVLTFGERVRSMEAKMNLVDKMKAALKGDGKPAPAPAAASSTKPSPEVVAEAVVIKNGQPVVVKALVEKFQEKQMELPATNPPEHGNATDPDSVEGKAQAKVSAGDRMGVVSMMASALVSARVFSVEDGRAPVKIAKLAVEIGDAVIAELRKK